MSELFLNTQLKTFDTSKYVSITYAVTVRETSLSKRKYVTVL